MSTLSMKVVVSFTIKILERVNDIVLENPVVQQLLVGNSGAMEVVNTEGVEMLAGYSTFRPPIGEL